MKEYLNHQLTHRYQKTCIHLQKHKDFKDQDILRKY